MRVVFIGKSQNFSLVPLNAVLTNHQVVGIVESAPRGKASIYLRVLRWLYREWTALTGEPCLIGEARKLRASYLYLDRASLGKLKEFIERLQPDIICVASMSMLLPEEVLAIPIHGAINLHPSKLPAYPGPFPWFWQYYDFQREIGITVHALDKGEDTGPILKQSSVTIATGTDILEAINLIAPEGGRLMREALDEIQAGTASYIPQPEESFPRARVISRDEKLIDWNWPIERVWHFLRGTYLWLDAIEMPKNLHGHFVIGEIDYGLCNVMPGCVGRDEHGYFVAHRDGRIRLLKKKTLMQSYLNNLF